LYIAPESGNMKRNVPIFGFIIGLLLPVVGLFIVYGLWGHGEGIVSFVRSLKAQPGLASKVMTLSLLTNLVPFVYYTSKRLDYTARGIFIATMLYAMVVVLVKFVW